MRICIIQEASYGSRLEGFCSKYWPTKKETGLNEPIEFLLTKEQVEHLAPLIRSASSHRQGTLFVATCAPCNGSWIMKAQLLHQRQIKAFMRLLKSS